MTEERPWKAPSQELPEELAPRVNADPGRFEFSRDGAWLSAQVKLAGER